MVLPGDDAMTNPTGTTSPGGTQSLWMSFLVIVVSEIGDKTFLISAVMAMTNSRILIFSAAMSALGLMTVLSALMGHVVPNLISKEYTQLAAAALFVIFGVKMLHDGYRMSDNEGQEELEQVTHELISKEDGVKDDDMETGGDSGKDATVLGKLQSGAMNVVSYFFTPVFIQTFVLTFLAEWGDRSQIATIALAGAEDFWWVTIGSLIGHALCSAIAVMGGRLLAARISVRTVTLLGAVLFIIFGFVGFFNIMVEKDEE
ncbi:hypothetical protein HDU76_013198 [Blyttiomyces sp. JEL0837]|nr:hypothetical protein HDU76_013198 [Blyttiomyces sp. JEL0837]